MELSTHHHHPTGDLTQGRISAQLLRFAVPLFFGQLLQQFYNVMDAWVVGNFATNDDFAAVSSAGSMTFLVIGLFSGIAVGGGVVISRYYGARDGEGLSKAIHTNFLLGLIASVLATAGGLVLAPRLLTWMDTPSSVMPSALGYYSVYFAGVSTVVMYNICMSILRALGDSMRPLYYLLISSLINVVLDLLFVAGPWHWGATGAAVATVIAQGISVALCLIRMCRLTDDTRLEWRKIRFYPRLMKEVLIQGLPTGIQNSVISVGNLTVQSQINSFGPFAMAGVGAYSKVEGFVFLPITSMSMALPTFISQNLGAHRVDRAKRGALFGIVSGVIAAEIMGIAIYFLAGPALKIFVEEPLSVEYGTVHMKIIAPFFFLLALSHCAAGALRGCGKAFIPMITMLAFWCGVRVVYVTGILKLIPKFRMIGWAYPLTWCLSSVVLTVVLLRLDWNKVCHKSGPD